MREKIKRGGFFALLLVLLALSIEAQVDTVKINKYYFKKCWTDAKAVAVSPFRWKGRDWAKLGIFIAAESGLTFADQPVKNLMLDHRNKTFDFMSDHIFEGFDITNNLIVISGLFTGGVIAQNQKCVSTALLSFESFAFASLLARGTKSLTGRYRPGDWRNEGPWAFKGPSHGGKSFPSGHTAATFAVASVIANQYRDSKWIPVTAYSVAGLVGLSRIYDNKHWLTDVVAGATLGTLMGNLVSRRTVNSGLTVVPFKTGNFQGMKIVYALN